MASSVHSIEPPTTKNAQQHQQIVDQFPWQRPPWHGGTTKYRLGLRPIDLEHWFQGPPTPDLAIHKHTLLRQHYSQVVQALPDSLVAQHALAEQMQRHGWYRPVQADQDSLPDPISALSLQVADDLCIMQSNGQQRLLAASVCSPSYWNVQEKIGLPMAQIHKPVQSLQNKIGAQIQRFIAQAPLMQPFERSNWFVHGSQQRMHLRPEGVIAGDPSNWFLRSERESLCRFHPDFLLFTINVRFAPLRDIANFPQALTDLSLSLAHFDMQEIDYFGGTDKYQRLRSYLAELA